MVGPTRNNFRPIKKIYRPKPKFQQHFRPIKNMIGPTQRVFRPTKNNQEGKFKNRTSQRMGLMDQSQDAYSNMRSQTAKISTTRTVPGQRAQPNLERHDSQQTNCMGIRKQQDDEHLSQLKLLSKQHLQHTKMKAPSSYTNSRNPLLARPNKAKERKTEEHNIRILIAAQRRQQQAKLHKRDALVEVNAEFFNALEHVYSWPTNRLIFACATELRKYWTTHLETARRCAYRAENIDPDNHGQIRYDIMVEIVKLETIRIEEFILAFSLFRSFLQENDMSETDETFLDDRMLSYFNPVQCNVIMDITPQWIEQARRPPLTWYGHNVRRNYPDPAIEDRLLDPVYYELSPTAL